MKGSCLLLVSFITFHKRKRKRKKGSVTVH
jgi:hypothetical protein